jgi:hypothetical protein
MNHPSIISAEEARKQLVLMNTPEKLKKREEALIQQTLNSIDEDIKNAIRKNERQIYYFLSEKVQDIIKKILYEQGYKITSIASNRYEYRLEW